MKTVLFDLDGTLLHMDIDEFVKAYFKLLGKTFGQKGYDVERVMKGLGAGLEAMIKIMVQQLMRKYSGMYLHNIPIISLLMSKKTFCHFIPMNLKTALL